ncbi:MAG: DUF11 domain-containing protein, partial [Bacteroides sp.]|nr:DUF11 domain-containing protein [Bacteroides sp.]
QSQLVKVDPSNGNVTYIGAHNNQWHTFGSMYFNAQGEIIAYGNDVTFGSGSGSKDQETLVKIDPATGVVNILGRGPETSNNDGASCAFGIELTKATSSTTVDSGEAFTYTFTIVNRTGAARTNITCNDVLTDGFLWNEEPQDVTGLTLGSTSIEDTATANFTITNIPTG